MLSTKPPVLISLFFLLLPPNAYTNDFDDSIPKRGLWPSMFTHLIRADQPDHWGNWHLDDSIVPGAIGSINPNTGDFEISGVMPGITTTKTPVTSTACSGRARLALHT